MAETSLLHRLDGIDARFEEVSLLITDPSVISDMKRFVKLTKEYKDLEKLTSVTNKYKKMLRDIDEAKAVLETESDPDLKELAKEELEANTNAIPALEEEIKLLLIPEDPEDYKNAIIEIRGGTGGDEAAIFAGDLLFLQATCSVCMPNIVKPKAGKWKCPASAKVQPEDTRKSSVPLLERKYTAHLNMNPEYIAYSVFRPQKLKAAYTHLPHPLPFCRKQSHLM